MDYRKTLNLPKTEFPMRASLPEREPAMYQEWETEGLYEARRRERQGRPKFVLHDGPPYANGDIHVGTALNKVVKDMINRVHALNGEDVVYVPGWDTHGLPIEMRALKTLGVDQHQIEPLALREESARVARHWIGVMTEEFRRLGVMADWEHPYITLNPPYEARELEVFAEMVERGLIYRDLRPVYWCPQCETALAEGEIEYQDHTSDAIFVAFPVRDANTASLPPGTRAVIWTTTPWTLPANVAIALGPDVEYVVVPTLAGPLLLARALEGSALRGMGLEAIGESIPVGMGRDLEGVVAEHPYLGHAVPFILGEHVTVDSGTGLVHTAPGHGVEDFEVGRRYGLTVVQPLDDQGRFRDDTPVVGGSSYQDANPQVLAVLQERRALLGHAQLKHSYPFCWRCHQPVIFRATLQWFLSVDAIRETLVEATYPVSWDPEWGGERMRQMVGGRQDWCLSRQRVWGLPIPAWYCEGCGDAILDAALIRHVAALVREQGADIWWRADMADLLPQGYQCPRCGGSQLRRETDVFDVWMDSGCSQAAALAAHPELHWPADLVLEGSDQYRGWFNTLLITSVATTGRAPYRGVLTHGWVLDGKGRPMHKSLGNVVDPMDLVARYGTDVFRLWVAASEFRTDVRISDAHMQQLAESYRKIRNTFRYLLGNLADFEPDAMALGEPPRDALNAWALERMREFMEAAQSACAAYQFHTVVHRLIHLVTVDLSSFYLDVVKDRLYTLAADDALRRETQGVLWMVTDTLVRCMAPILIFTAEEVWQAMPHREEEKPASVHLAEWPKLPRWNLEAARDLVDRSRQWREPVLKALEEQRAAKVIGNSLEAEVTMKVAPSQVPGEAEQRLLAELAMVARLDVVADAGVTEPRIEVARTEWGRCDRCWRYVPEVPPAAGTEEASVCHRCRSVLETLPRELWA